MKKVRSNRLLRQCSQFVIASFADVEISDPMLGLFRNPHREVGESLAEVVSVLIELQPSRIMPRE